MMGDANTHPLFDTPLPMGWKLLLTDDVKSTEKSSCVAGPFGSNISSKFFVESGVPVIRGGNLRSDLTRFVPSGFAFVSEEQAMKYKAQHVRAGDLVFTCWGTLGQVGLIPKTGPFPEYIISNKQLKLRPNLDIADPEYLFYYFAGPKMVEHVLGKAIGAAVPGINLGILKEIPLVLPPLVTQQRIAGILSAYDELIEISKQRIKILESMARALYQKTVCTGKKSVVAHSIVESPYWRFISENVSNYSGTKRYYATADVDDLEITGAGVEYSFREKPSRAQKQPIPNSVWFARMKETYKIVWYGPLNNERVSGVMLSSGFAGFEALDDELWPLLFLTISSGEFHVQKDLFCTGSTQMSLTNEGLSRIVLPLPDEQSSRQLGRTVGPILTTIAALQLRNENLRANRDLLLPRLLSGQIDVSLQDEEGAA